MPPPLPPLLSLPRSNPDAALALTPRRGSQPAASPFRESLNDALSTAPGIDSNQPKRSAANRSQLQADEPAAESRGDVRKQATIEQPTELDVDDSAEAVSHDAVDRGFDEGPDFDTESWSQPAARRSSDNQDAQESPDSAQASQADGAPIAPDQEIAAAETTSTSDQVSPATNSIGQPVHVDAAPAKLSEYLRYPASAQALPSLQGSPTQQPSQALPISVSARDATATAAVADFATASAPTAETWSSQPIANRVAPSAIVSVDNPDGATPTSNGGQQATSTDAPAAGNAPSAAAPGAQAGAALAANSAAVVEAASQVQLHPLTPATSIDAAPHGMTIGADAMNSPDPEPLPSMPSHQVDAARGRFNAQLAGSSASEAPPAAARAAQVDAAIRLENATGLASSQEAAMLRSLQLASGGTGAGAGGGWSSHGQSLGPHADTPLPTFHLAPGLDDDRFSGRIVRGLSAMVNQRGGVMLMRLDPPELGQLRVQMTIQRGIVSAQFDAASPEARALLDKSMAVLRTALESHGLTVERLSVHHLPAPTPSTWNDDRSSPNQQQQTSQRHDADAGGGQSRGRRDDDPSRFGQPSRDDGAFARDFNSLTSSAA